MKGAARKSRAFHFMLPIYKTMLAPNPLKSHKVEHHVEMLVNKSEENPSESVIEDSVLQMFRQALGFGLTTTLKQQTNIETGGIKDVVLHPDQTTRIIVEVKRPTKFKWNAPKRAVQPREKAIIQAARYIISEKPSQEFGIATDGVDWILFQVKLTKPRSKIYKVHPLLHINAKDERDLTCRVLKRLQKNTAKKFFKMLAAVHQEATESEFIKTMNLSLDGRVAWCEQKASLSEDDKQILRGFYDAGRDVEPWLSLLKSDKMSAIAQKKTVISQVLKIKKS